MPLLVVQGTADEVIPHSITCGEVADVAQPRSSVSRLHVVGDGEVHFDLLEVD